MCKYRCHEGEYSGRWNNDETENVVVAGNGVVDAVFAGTMTEAVVVEVAIVRTKLLSTATATLLCFFQQSFDSD